MKVACVWYIYLSFIISCAVLCLGPTVIFQVPSISKPTALLSVFDKENSIEFPLDFVYYLYTKSNLNPSFYPMLPYESFSSCASIDNKIKKRKYKRKTIIRN